MIIDKTTLNNILDSITILTALTYYVLWYERTALKSWQIRVGNVAAIVYTIAMIVRLILFILA